MKKLFILVALIFYIQGSAQKYYTKTGQINFEASVPAFEPVKASHKTVTALLNTDSGEMAVLALMKGFRFRNALMEEHFNENYMESDTYPKAVFKGLIDNFSIENLQNTSSFIANGTLTLHGKSKKIKTTIEVNAVDDSFTLQTNFSVAPGDFDIKIPSVVSEKISDQIVITVDFKLVEK